MEGERKRFDALLEDLTLAHEEEKRNDERELERVIHLTAIVRDILNIHVK